MKNTNRRHVGFIIAIIAVFIMAGCAHKTEAQIPDTKISGEVITIEEAKSKNSDFELIPNILYHVLENEYVDNADPANLDKSILVREYIQYDGIGNGVSYQTHRIPMPKQNEIKSNSEFKNSIAPESLRLLPYTIVSEKVANQWKEEGYEVKNEYWELSKEGLTYDDVKGLTEK